MFVAITKKINEEEKKLYGNGMGNNLTEVNKHLNKCCKVELKLKLAWIKVKIQIQTQTQTRRKETRVRKVVINKVLSAR